MADGTKPDLKEGVKLDSGKLPIHLYAFDALEETTKVLDFGARKYSERNWELGMKWSRVFSALLRHLFAWWAKRGTDPETGLSHLAHASCCLMFLLAYELRGVGQDDRPDYHGR
jgi:hypothetical protein